ncbi:MAG: YwaF family protein [Clostridia bacterium]|nr:YwaF family protein [Clostridia bacterium]
MREFFGFGGYQREPEGYFSWQHIVFVTTLVVIMAALAIWLGLRNRHRDERVKNKVLIIAALAIDGFELWKIILLCFRSGDPWDWLYTLPLFLCSIQLITIPLAAFSKGRLREAALDFVFIFGLLGALLGTYAAGNNYGSYPVLSFDNVVSGITHCISGMASMKKRNIFISFSILLSFCVAALIANIALDYNYMFLMRGDGTPYDILYNLVGGNPIIYPIIVIGLFILYITVFYLIYMRLSKKKEEKNA